MDEYGNNPQSKRTVEVEGEHVEGNYEKLKEAGWGEIFEVAKQKNLLHMENLERFKNAIYISHGTTGDWMETLAAAWAHYRAAQEKGLATKFKVILPIDAANYVKEKKLDEIDSFEIIFFEGSVKKSFEDHDIKLDARTSLEKLSLYYRSIKVMRASTANLYKVLKSELKDANKDTLICSNSIAQRANYNLIKKALNKGATAIEVTPHVYAHERTGENSIQTDHFPKFSYYRAGVQNQIFRELTFSYTFRLSFLNRIIDRRNIFGLRKLEKSTPKIYTGPTALLPKELTEHGYTPTGLLGTDPELDAELSEDQANLLLKINEIHENGGKVVVIAPGSMYISKESQKSLLANLKIITEKLSIENVTFLMVGGWTNISVGDSSQGELETNQSNATKNQKQNDIEFIPYMPYSKLFPISDLVMCAFGMGTATYLMESGCPGVAFAALEDQSAYAKRAMELGYPLMHMLLGQLTRGIDEDLDGIVHYMHRVLALERDEMLQAGADIASKFFRITEISEHPIVMYINELNKKVLERRVQNEA